MEFYGQIMEFEPNRPKWEQVAVVIEARIDDGTYPPGSRVPTGLQLQTEFGIANITAQKVIRALRDRGRVETVVGMGSFVVGAPAESGE